MGWLAASSRLSAERFRSAAVADLGAILAVGWYRPSAVCCDGQLLGISSCDCCKVLLIGKLQDLCRDEDPIKSLESFLTHDQQQPKKMTGWLKNEPIRHRL